MNTTTRMLVYCVSQNGMLQSESRFKMQDSVYPVKMTWPQNYHWCKVIFCQLKGMKSCFLFIVGLTNPKTQNI